MNCHFKRIISIAFVLILVVSLAAPAFAADKVFYQQGSVTVGMNFFYSSGDYSYGSVRLVLAEGEKKVSIDKKSIQVDPGTSGATISSMYLRRNDQKTSAQKLNKGKWKLTNTSTYNYTLELWLSVDREGTATVRYSVDGKPYTANLTIRKYLNPVKSVTVTGVRNGKNLADAQSSDRVKVNQSAKTVKKARLKVVTSKDWVLKYIFMRDNNTDLYRSVFAQQSDTLKTATINWGKLMKSNKYDITLQLFNTKTHQTEYLYYDINA